MIREPQIARFGSVDVELFRSTPDLRLPEHGHDSVHYCLPIRGRFYEADGKDEVLLAPGWLRASPPGDRHRIRFGPEVADCLLVFELPGFRPGRREQPPSRRTLPLGTEAGLAHSILEQMRTPDLISQLVVDEAALRLAAVARRPRRAAGQPPTWLVEVRERLQECLPEVPSLARLAAGAGVHRSQLVRAFRGHYGCSIGDFLRRRRLVEALRQIGGSAKPLSAIAADCGFSDQSHMTRQVVAFAGQPPGRLRKSRRA